MSTYLSIVSPVYRAEHIVSDLVARIETAMLECANRIFQHTPTSIRIKQNKTQSFDYEIILVNDASPDESWSAIQKECQRNPRVKGINLSRNFGQHYAITAGLRFAKGEYVVVMDCDLQDRPEEIPNLLHKAVTEDYDIVYARRVNRQDKWLKRLSSTLFTAVFDWFSGMHRDKTIANFGVYKQCVIREYNRMPEQARAFGPLIRYLGFRTTAIDVEHAQRAEGKSSYNLHKLLKLSFDVIISNSNKPLRIAVVVGFIMSFLSFALALYNIIANLAGFISVPGYTTTIFSIWFVGGLLLFVMGILGLYIGKIFDQVKGRQLFIVRDKINIEE